MYATPNSPLSQFILRYSNLPPREQGHDTTVVPISTTPLASYLPSDVKDKLKARNNRHREFRYIGIHRRDASDEDLRDDTKTYRYIISYPPLYATHSPFGRATRGMMAYDQSQGTYCFIKDYWRSTTPGMEKEGEIYRTLERHGIPYIANLVCGNDFPLDDTCSNQSATKQWALCLTAKTHVEPTPLRHYRIALDKVGEALTTFKSTRELVQAIADAMEAHDAAYFRAKILHRDISVGNIMIDENRRGFLIDWDLCVHLEVEESTEQLGLELRCRTGTWQLMSAKLLQGKQEVQGIEDDRESAFHVLTWVALCYTHHDKTDVLQSQLRHYEQEYFDGKSVKGGELKASKFQNPWEVEFASPPLNLLIEELRKVLSIRYMPNASMDLYNILMKINNEDVQKRLVHTHNFFKAERKIKDCFWLVNMLRNYVKSHNWPTNDEAKPNQVASSLAQKSSTQTSKSVKSRKRNGRSSVHASYQDKLHD